MKRRRLLAPLAIALVLAGSMARLSGAVGAADLPARLTDAEFWKLTEDLSEPNGSFTSDNLLSNEIVFARTVPDLIARTKPGGVYLGVGPEQNFTYITAIKPRMAFITDIRRGNLHTQLMYKALFELSANRAEFLSRLFTKPKPANLPVNATVTQLMDHYWEAFVENEAAYDANLKAIHQHLTKTHAFPLPQEDLDGVARVYRTFYWYGPAMNYSASTTLSLAGAGRGTTYWDLMVQGDGLSYLGSEEKFAFMKDLESRNMLVPVVGNFAGPKALRAVGAYIKDHGATVTAFYLSNVEGYLQRAGIWQTFCANVATFPLDDASLFIRPSGSGMVILNAQPIAQPIQVQGAAGAAGGVITPKTRVIGTYTPGGAGSSGLVPIAPEVKGCAGSF
jgi:hypothetical protein